MKFTSGIILSFIICSCNNQAVIDPPPEAVTVATPVSVSEKTNDSAYYLMVLLKKDNTIWYRYNDSVSRMDGFKQIQPFTTTAIVKKLNELEKENNIDLSRMGNNILLKSGRGVELPGFKTLKEAFREKQILRFKIVTTNE